MRFHEILSEKRRNPETNQKIAALDALAKYAGRLDVFVSFTEDVGQKTHNSNSFANDRKARNASGAKLGVNPRSQWETTPLGIYSYPIDYVLKKNGHVPFAGDEPFIWVFRADMKKMLNLSDATDYDVERAEQFCPIIKQDPEAIWDDARGIWDAYRKQATSNAWKKSKTTPMREMSRLLMAAGYVGAVDYGKSIIHVNEPTQAVFFSRSGIQELEMVRNISPRDMSKVDLYAMKWKVFYRDLMANRVDEPTAVAVVSNASSIFYAMTDEQIDAVLAKLPEEALQAIHSDAEGAIANSRGALLRAFPDISDDQIIQLLKSYTNVVSRLPKKMLTPKLADFIVQYFADFAPNLPPDLLPPEVLDKAFENHPRGLRRMALGSQSTEALQMRYLKLGREEAADVADSRYVTPAALVAAVDVMLANNGEESAYDAMRHWMERVKFRTVDDATAKKVLVLVAQRHPKFGKTLTMTFPWLEEHLSPNAV